MSELRRFEVRFTVAARSSEIDGKASGSLSPDGAERSGAMKVAKKIDR